MKFRKGIFLLALVLALTGAMLACNPTPPPATTYYEIKFFEADGITLLSTQRVESGAAIVYEGYDPKTPVEAGFEFTFMGWSEQKGGTVATSMIASKNTSYYAIFAKSAVQKTLVAIPEQDPKTFVWNDEVQTYTVAPSPHYTVFGNEERNAGRYTVEVILKHPETHSWANGSTEPLHFDFVIAQAQNEWKTEPSLMGWEAGSAAQAPSGEAKYGTVVYTYSTAQNGPFTDTAPTKAGTYYLKASVPATENYTGLEVVKTFVVDKNTYTVTLKDANGNLITAYEAKKGAPIEYDVDDLIPEDTVETSYSFGGWSLTQGGAAVQSPVAEGEKTFYLVVASAPRTYRVTFEDADGTKLDEQLVAYGSSFAYKGSPVTPPAGEMITSVFTGWTKKGESDLVTVFPAVTGELTFVAAYEITFSTLYGDSAQNPYVLTTASELAFLSGALDKTDFAGKFFRLGADVTMTVGIGFGAQNAFAGTFDGDGKKITLNVQNGQDTAVFARNGGTLKNLTVVASVLTTGKAAGIAVQNSGRIEACSVEGTVTGATAAGAIVAENLSGGTVSCCEADAVVSLDAIQNLCGVYYEDLVGTPSKKLGLLVGENNGTLTLAPSVWNGTDVAKAFASGDGTSASPYVIETAAQLAYFKDGASANSYWSGKYFVLASSIDLGGKGWSGVGGGTSGSGFAGYFDGAGHAIYNFVPTAITADRRAFFNSVAKGATVRNLTLHGHVEGAPSVNFVALLAAISGGEYKNIRIIGSVTGTANTVSLGLAWHEGGDLENVSVFGSVRGEGTVGGIVGYDKSTSTLCGYLINCKNYAALSIGTFGFAASSSTGIGGIAGCIGSQGAIENCVNYGSVTGTEESNGGSGGIVGTMYASTVRGCSNLAPVTSGNMTGGIVGYQRNNALVTACSNYGNVTGLGAQVGGIAGYLGNTSGTARIEQSSNFGAVTGATNAIAGIAGHGARSIVVSCVNEGTVTAGAGSYWVAGIVGMQGSNGSVTDCENKGTITGDGTMQNNYAGVGGIIGSNYASAVSGCNNSGAVTGVCYVGGVVGYAQSADGSVTNCDNLAGGTVTATVADTAAACGGIVGYNNGAVSSCENFGTVSSATTAQVPMVGGIIGYDNSAEGKVGDDNLDHTA